MADSSGNRPGGRQRNITGIGKAEKRGEGLKTGPVGPQTRETVIKIIAGLLSGKKSNH